jgi:hypothetical protein
MGGPSGIAEAIKDIVSQATTTLHECPAEVTLQLLKPDTLCWWHDLWGFSARCDTCPDIREIRTCCDNLLKRAQEPPIEISRVRFSAIGYQKIYTS